ncbi:MAG: AAA family ATPase [Nitrospira sp.]|nr:AAA family ATPase [Nitrospira sp.]
MQSFNSTSSHQSTFPDLAKRLVSFDSIMRDPLPPIDWLVESLIPNGTRTVVFGEFGSMKSWTLLDLALHIAAGRKWLDTFDIPQARSVLYIDEEMPEHELRRRVKRLGEGLELRDVSIPFRATSHLGVRFHEDQVERLLLELHTEGFDPDIILVETLRRVLNGNENDATDVGEFWHSVAPILVAKKTLIVAHHMKKPSLQKHEPNRHRASGSTDILAGADMAYAITRHQDHLTISCEKNRVAPEIKPFSVQLVVDENDEEQGPIIMQYVGLPQLSDEELTKLEQAKGAILAFLQDQQLFVATREDILADLKQHDIAERTGDRALGVLYKTGVVEKAERGLYRLRLGLKAV